VAATRVNRRMHTHLKMSDTSYRIDEPYVVAVNA
jgi:hypothetical protein